MKEQNCVKILNRPLAGILKVISGNWFLLESKNSEMKIVGPLFHFYSLQRCQMCLPWVIPENFSQFFFRGFFRTEIQVLKFQRGAKLRHFRNSRTPRG